jgi:hypothetical protein
MRRILLVEPAYKNKYPPMGLMKISTYHKQIGDEVFFCKGMSKELRDKNWDRIYVTTMFTFHWDIVIKTIRFYLSNIKSKSILFIGGPMATIMADEIHAQEELGDITIKRGLLDQPGMLDTNDIIVDELILDYNIIDMDKNGYLDYEYPLMNDYFIYSTKGCIRNCEFCAVPIIEPKFKSYIDIKPKIEQIRKMYGEKHNLILMDNNIVASPKLSEIIEDIISCGFGKENNDYKYQINGKNRTKKRYVDFNQGVDARILYEHPEKMSLLAKVAVKPLRIAFDHADDEFVKIYKHCMHMAAENNIQTLSNYILFNLYDTPADLYNRLEINLQLNLEFENKGYGTRIWSFPMRLAPLFGDEAKGRKHVGPNWTRKQIRGVQCIQNATHGVVGPKIGYFHRAFGKSVEEFKEILWMPENYILWRSKFESNKKTFEWKKQFRRLNSKEMKELKNLLSNNSFLELNSTNKKINLVLEHYKK